jgi:hypothetical protein
MKDKTLGVILLLPAAITVLLICTVSSVAFQFGTVLALALFLDKESFARDIYRGLVFFFYPEAVKKAVFKFGKEKSTSWGNLGAEDFMKHMISDEIGVATMQFKEVEESSPDRAEFTFGRYPLEEGWNEMGLAPELRSRLCALASEHDFGIVDNDAILKLDMPEAIGKGDPVCRLIFTKTD